MAKLIKKAQKGSSLLPDWNKVKATLNYKNWGVPDYSDKGNFNTAYSTARKAGEKEFMWNNTRYDSDIETDRTQNSFNLLKEKRKKIYHSVNPTGYPSKEIIPAIKRYITKERVSEEDILYDRKEWTPNQDAWAFYLGLPQSNTTISESSYKPTISNQKNARYYTLRNSYPDFDEIVMDEAEKYLKNSDLENEIT